MTRDHVETNNISLIGNLYFDSNVRQWSYPLMIPMHCLWAKSINRTRGQFEYDVVGFVFVLISFTCKVWLLLFHSLFAFITAYTRV